MKKLLYSLLVVTALVSCSSDDLKLSPTNGLSTSTAIQTKSNVGMILTGAYDQNWALLLSYYRSDCVRRYG